MIDAMTGELDLSSVSANEIYTITYSSSGSCPTTFTQTITILPGDDSSFGYPLEACINGMNPTPITVPVVSGTYSVDSTAMIDAMTG